MVFFLTVIAAKIVVVHPVYLPEALVIDAIALSYFPISTVIRSYSERQAEEYAKTLT